MQRFIAALLAGLIVLLFGLMPVQANFFGGGGTGATGPQGPQGPVGVQGPAGTSGTAVIINARDYGAIPDDGLDDKTSIQNALNAALTNPVATLVIDDGTYEVTGTMSNASASNTMRPPEVTDAAAGTDILTFDKVHTIATGEPLEFQGFLIPGTTNGTMYFGCAPTTTTLKLYNTRGNAISCGATGLVDITGNVTTTGGAITAGTDDLTVTSVPAGVEVGVGLRVAGTAATTGSFIITAISGTNLTLSQNATTTVSGQTVTFVSAIDSKYLNYGITIHLSPQTILKKSASFSGTSIFSMTVAGNVTLEGGTLIGLNADQSLGIQAGDDLYRVSGARHVGIYGVRFKNCGDSAWRLSTGTNDYAARTASNPKDGVNTHNITAIGNYVLNCFQTSSTTDDLLHGGSRNYSFINNTIENLGGSIKFASRAPGAENIIIMGNTINKSHTHGFEIDSTSNMIIANNVLNDIDKHGIYIASNGLAGIAGFDWGNIKIHHNIFNVVGSDSTSGAFYRGVYIQPDLYSPAYLFDVEGLEITDNIFNDMTNQYSLGINLVAGSYKGLKINRNQFNNFGGAHGIYIQGRGSTTSGFINDFDISDNRMELTLSTANAIRVERTSGTEQLSEIRVRGNRIFGSAANVFYFGQLKNIHLEDNRVNVTGATIIPFNSAMSDYHVTGNRLETTATNALNLDSITGLYIYDNPLIKSATGTPVSLQNTSSSVWFVNNKVSGGSPAFRQVDVNTRGLDVNGRIEYATAAPTSGTWRVGDIIYNTAVAAGGSPGWICTTAGTAGTLAAVTGSINSGTDDLTVSSGSAIGNGAYITIAGVSGIKRASSGGGTTAITIDSNADATVAGAAIAYSAPVFKTMAAVAAFAPPSLENVIDLTRLRFAA